MAHDILIVDDEADIRVLTAGILEDEGYQARDAASSTDALASVEVRRPSLVLLDIWLQGSELDGIDVLRVLKEEHPTIPVLMMSGARHHRNGRHRYQRGRLRLHRESRLPRNA